ncbi:type IV pilin [Natrinema salsiterrestre]|uniref:Type IV pilin N-terminal domain-containing protein n=1 Tax=Natrinema salsiterrestre TaxID=2950540 RepID=A0A9Q4KX81_9EURY|nr:type IV pilin [Natrinema salsiterrestre]MDF9744878.1 type IV pilin N-terminal domain-containing protein [Natrinema salsiterrestre]
MSDRRGVSPILGVLLLLALTVCLATVVAVGLGGWSPESAGPNATFELSADADGSSIALEHVAGDPIDVEALSVTIAINGTELSAQPPVPFVGASGFRGTPDGPFNARTESEWTPGEEAGVSVAETNTPTLEAGDSVTVTLVVDGRRIAELETTAT